jgi:hypothetical protein
MSNISLYRVSWDCPDQGMRQEWCTTEAKAIRFARRERIPADSLVVDLVEIPKTKVKLCEWLNKHFSTDNG